MASVVTGTPASLSSASVRESESRRIGLFALMSVVVMSSFEVAVTTAITLRFDDPEDPDELPFATPLAAAARRAASSYGVNLVSVMRTCTARSGNTSNSRVEAPS